MPQREIMRIIAGKYKRRMIYGPNVKTTRPTKDRVRESVFMALSSLDDKIFLDLYAGSGSIGLEAISRGAKKTYFVDRNIDAIKCIKENIINLNITEDYEIIKNSDVDALKAFKEKNIKFDVIYLDPPYEEGEYQKIIDMIFDFGLLNEYGIIICESDKKLDIINPHIVSSKEYKYGDIYVTFYRS